MEQIKDGGEAEIKIDADELPCEQAFCGSENQAEEKNPQFKDEDGKNSQTGNFENAEKLLKAYNALQAEFTKRCQKLKAVTERRQEEEKELTKEITQKIMNDTDVRQRIIAAYLCGLDGANGEVALLGGSGFSTVSEREKPKTLAQAKKLADLMIKG